MADNVNIIVQDTINDIVVNAAVIVETIDINVQAAVDVVDIVANPNNYVVNINRIIGEQVQSDWTQTDNQAPDYIKNKPTIPAAQVNSDWDATTGVAEILNKPTIPTATSDLTNDGSDGVNPFITAADIPPVTGFVPYTGATANVDLGEYELKAGQVTLDTTPTGTAAVATTRWNDTIGSTETTLKGGSVVLKNGVDLVARVVNKVTPNATLTKAAYQAVRISGAQGQRLAVAYAQANNDNNSADTIGIVCETIATNQEGFILTVGQLEEINTTGSLQGETWADGDVLYLSPTTAGKLTNIKPTGATGHIVVMGYVEYAHAIHGKIYVKIMNGWELDELHNVYITSPANNEGLFYDSADSLWKNETIASALGYTPVTNARTISTTAPLSGGGDLTANRTLSITQASTSTDGFLSSTNWNTFNNKFTLPALTSGSVLFSNGTTIAQDNSNLFWDDTNNRLGIGTATPAHSLTINSAIPNTTIGFYNQISNVNNRNWAVSSNVIAYGDFSISQSNAINGNPISAGTQRLYISAAGNVLIGTTTDAGFRLDVNGTARVQGALTVSTGGADITTGTATTFIRRSSTLHLGIAIAVDGAADFRINGTTKFYIGASATNSLEIPHTLRVAFVNPGVATFSNILWDNTNTEFRFVNGANSDTVNLRTSRFICSNISNTFNSSAQLQVDSTTRGFLPPRMTTTEKNAIATPAAGLIVYDTTLNKLCVRTASAWETITSI